MSPHLVEFARFSNSEEASLARSQLDAEDIPCELEGEAVAGWLWHFGTAVGGVRLLIAKDDLQRAQEVLGQVSAIDELEGIDFGDRSSKDEDDQRSELPENLIRAYRAALIGMFLMPPLLNCYSLWLLIRHRFFLSQGGNWRVPVACLANIMIFSLVIMIVSLIVSPPAGPPQIILPNGQPAKYIEREVTIPIVP